MAHGYKHEHQRIERARKRQIDNIHEDCSANIHSYPSGLKKVTLQKHYTTGCQHPKTMSLLPWSC